MKPLPQGSADCGTLTPFELPVPTWSPLLDKRGSGTMKGDWASDYEPRLL